ncbi:hypothetical protein [Parabacteroides provencensis]|uniref:hypothetical protein n=1 Tax=Parabacteroides provencensis TaxID=1944636 RepID=UPI00117D63B8|nr:hypothetical protein [Parabacteroides provencensis]
MAKKINFNVNLVDAYGEVIKVRLRPTDKEESPLKVSVLVINSLMHQPSDDAKIVAAEEIVKRLTLQQKVAKGIEQEYSTDELALIRESVLYLYSKKDFNSTQAGTILNMTK